MSPLAELIAQRGKDKTDQEMLDLGNSLILVGEDPELWRYIGVADQFGSQVAEAIYQAVLSQLPGAAASFISPGLALNNDTVQGMLTILANQFTAGNMPSAAQACNALKKIGRDYQSVFEVSGLSNVTLADIAAARQEVIYDDWYQHLIYDVLPPLRGQPPEIIKAAVAGL